MPQIQIRTKQLITYEQWIDVTDEELEILKEQIDSDIYETHDREAYNIIDSKIDHMDVLESDDVYQDFEIIN